METVITGNVCEIRVWHRSTGVTVSVSGPVELMSALRHQAWEMLDAEVGRHYCRLLDGAVANGTAGLTVLPPERP